MWSRCFLLLILAAAPATADLEVLDWLAGGWVGTHQGAAIEERWTRPSGDTMMGLSRIVADEKTVHTEFLLLRRSADGTYLDLLLPGKEGMRFVARRLGPDEAVFERLDKEERITYRLRPGGGLQIVLEEAEGTVTEFHLRREEPRSFEHLPETSPEKKKPAAEQRAGSIQVLPRTPETRFRGFALASRS